MERDYLLGNIRQRMQELMKEHKFTQAQLVTRIAAPKAPSAGLSAAKLIRLAQNICFALQKCLKYPQISCWWGSQHAQSEKF